MTSLDILFGATGLIVAASAVLAVTTPHLVHAALWLVVTLGTLAGSYLILGAELVALVQLLVYVGAVVVLVLFALMLTRAPVGPSPEHSSSAVQRIAAAVLGVAPPCCSPQFSCRPLAERSCRPEPVTPKGLPPSCSALGSGPSSCSRSCSSWP